MKKYFTTEEYKRWHKRRIKKNNRPKVHIKRQRLKVEPRVKNAEKRNNTKYNKNWFEKQMLAKVDLKPTINFPVDLRLIENTEDCIRHFDMLRSKNYISSDYQKKKFILVSLSKVKYIDYGSVSILKAIIYELSQFKINLKGELPEDPQCKKYLEESGFLNDMYDSNGNKFPKALKSQLMFFNKGEGKLSFEENKKLSELIKKVVLHLTDKEEYCPPVRTVVLEICGNSIEWSDARSKKWLLGASFEDDKVIFTALDLGKGILKTLHKKFDRKLKELFTGMTELDILNGAYQKKYGSKSEEDNRNKGLPSIKRAFKERKILALVVLTNNVILHFNNEKKSKTFFITAKHFKGTFYQWEMTKDCLAGMKQNS